VCTHRVTRSPGHTEHGREETTYVLVEQFYAVRGGWSKDWTKEFMQDSTNKLVPEIKEIAEKLAQERRGDLPL
jgi:hypothetical protein